MRVNILLVTHDEVGKTLINTLQRLIGTLPLKVLVLPVSLDCEPTAICDRLDALYQNLDTGSGVLVLTDIFGATPCNLACRNRAKHHIRVITGLNLPMLIKIMNYPDKDLAALADIAIVGGKQGIIDVDNF